MGLVGTTVALVLGLLIASAKGFYDTQNTETIEAAANIVLLDRVLIHYGPEANAARARLRDAVAKMSDLQWLRAISNSHLANATNGEVMFDKIQELSPQDDDHRLLKTEAVNLAMKLGQTRWLMFEQMTSSIPTTLLAMLVFWLVLLFVSFGMFVRPNVTVVSSLFISALAVSGAIFLILEMYQPYGGFIHISSAPLRVALTQIGP
jgi:hypothetical protein